MPPMARLNESLAKLRDRLGLDAYSPGVIVIMVVGVLSTFGYLFWPVQGEADMEVWVFDTKHMRTYNALMQANVDTEFDPDKSPLPEVRAINLGSALSRRVLSAFWADTPVGDVLEVERMHAAQYFAAPLESVGLVDLTDRLKEEGIMDEIVAASFSLWTTRGRIFGIPHDVHPVMIAYRSDIIEQETGQDAETFMAQIETWDDFERVMRPLVKDTDGDGRNDRYPINVWPTNSSQLEVFMLQNGGGTFKLNPQTGVAELALDSDANAEVLARIVSWCVGPDRIAIDAPEWDPAGNKMRLEGRVLCSIMPDWLIGVWITDMPDMSGKVRLMKMPAWRPGGLRTSVWGGTMLSVPKSTEDFETAWRITKRLYLSVEHAEQLFKNVHIISPVIKFWEEDFYHEENPYFGGQRTGTMYIELAHDVPHRVSSPFQGAAMNRAQQAMLYLYEYAQDNEVYSREQLLPKAQEFLKRAQERVEWEMDRKVLIKRDNERYMNQGQESGQ